MGFRRSLVRIQSPRHRKGWRNNKLRQPLFFPPEARVGNWVGNPGVPRRVVPEDAGPSPEEPAAGQQEQASRLTRGNGRICSCVRIIRGIWAAKNAWFVEIGNARHQLGKHPENAPPPRKRKRGDPPPTPPDTIMQAYYRLMATAGRKLPEAETLRVATVCDLFLDYSQKHHDAGHLPRLQGLPAGLSATCTARCWRQDLKPLHVTRWLDAHPGWKGGRRNAVIAIKRAFNWADAEGLLQPNPIKAVKKPPQRHRDRVLTPEERQEILAAIKDQAFREFVFAMKETGCRPGEVRKVTAAHVNLELGVWVFKEHKTAKRTGKPRIIYLTPAMVELTRKLIELVPRRPAVPRPEEQAGLHPQRHPLPFPSPAREAAPPGRRHQLHGPAQLRHRTPWSTASASPTSPS